MSYSGGGNLSSVKRFIILVSRGVFFFDNARRKNEVKSRPHTLVALVLESGLRPFLLEDSYLSQVPLLP